MDFLILYLLCGLFITAMLYNEAIYNGVTGDLILSCLPARLSVWYRSHVYMYRLSVVLAFFICVLIWPYVAYKLSDLRDYE